MLPVAVEVQELLVAVFPQICYQLAEHRRLFGLYLAQVLRPPEEPRELLLHLRRFKFNTPIVCPSTRLLREALAQHAQLRVASPRARAEERRVDVAARCRREFTGQRVSVVLCVVGEGLLDKRVDCIHSFCQLLQERRQVHLLEPFFEPGALGANFVARLEHTGHGPYQLV